MVGAGAPALPGRADDSAPDVVHVHNLFPLLSGSVPRPPTAGVPVVWTVHNRRLRCVAGGHFRDGAPCRQCRPGWRIPGIVHRCYAGSTAASALRERIQLAVPGDRRDGVVPVAISRHMAGWLGSSAGFDARGRRAYNAVDAPAPLTDPASGGASSSPADWPSTRGGAAAERGGRCRPPST